MRRDSASRTAGYVVAAIDLPGAERGAGNPASFFAEPFDRTAFAQELSPSAQITQVERTAAVMALVDDVAARANGTVVLVGHSMGGLTITPVAQAVPDKLAAVVHLAAYMLRPGGLVEDVMDEDSKLLGLLCADPAVTGAFRFDVAARDAEYRRLFVGAFYGDLSDTALAVAFRNLHCDEPMGVTLEPSPVTADFYGTTPRHYIRRLADQAIPVARQDQMIAEMDRVTPSATVVHALAASHSPFLSQPDELVAILKAIATNRR